MRRSNGWQPTSLDAVLATNPLFPSNLDAARCDLPVICHPTACTGAPAPPPPALTLASSPSSTTNTAAPLCFASHSIMVRNTLIVYSRDHLLLFQPLVPTCAIHQHTVQRSHRWRAIHKNGRYPHIDTTLLCNRNIHQNSVRG